MSMYHSPTIEDTKLIKLVLSIIIVLSHLGVPILCDINYLPVGLFFFMSGYGLNSSFKNGHKYRLGNNILKVLLPFYIAELVYCLIFSDVEKYTSIEIVKCIVLWNIPLPYSWYVRAQLLCYIFWAFAYKKQGFYKYVTLMIGIILYSVYVISTGQSITFCKTIFCFLIGSLYSQYEDVVNKHHEKYRVKSIYAIIGFLGVLLIAILDSRGIICYTSNAMSSFLICNCLAAVFSFCLFVLIGYYSSQSKDFCLKLNWLSKLSYEIYLVQGIAQCFFCKTYYCDRVIIPISNGYISRLMSFMLVFPLAFILYIINCLLRRKRI